MRRDTPRLPRMQLSLDLSTKSSGWAIMDGNKLVDYGCITANDNDKVERIHKMVAGLQWVVGCHDIDKVIVEEVRPVTDKDTNKMTARALNWLQAAVGIMLHDDYNLEMDYILPNSWRSKIGIKVGAGIRRDALKTEDIKWVKENYGIDVNDDIADAIGIGASMAMKNHGAW